MDQGEFEAMKTLSGRRAPRCDKHEFRAKMTVSTQTVLEMSLLNIVVSARKKEEYEKWHFHDRTLLRLAVFRVTLSHLSDHKGTQRGTLGAYFKISF